MDKNLFLNALLARDLPAALSMLLEGMPIDTPYLDGKTALHYAAEQHLVSVGEWLLNHGADPNARDDFGQTPLFIAIDSEADSAKHEYVHTGKWIIPIETTKMLLMRGGDPNAKTNRGVSLLQLARDVTHKSAVELLLQYGAKG